MSEDPKNKPPVDPKTGPSMPPPIPQGPQRPKPDDDLFEKINKFERPTEKKPWEI